MSLLGRLRDWVASLFGSGPSADETAGEPPAGVCAVCGTDVPDPEEGCPLCGSLDVDPRGATAAAPEPSATRDDGSPPDGDAAADGPAVDTETSDASADGANKGPMRRSVEGTTDDAVTRLRDVTDADGDAETDGNAGPDETGEPDATDGRADEVGDGDG